MLPLAVPTSSPHLGRWRDCDPRVFLALSDGGVHATSGVVPEVTRAIYADVRAGRLEAAFARQRQITELLDSAFLGADFPEGFRIAAWAWGLSRILDWLRFADFADRNLPVVSSATAVRDRGVFHPAHDTLPVPPPPGAIVLFGDGSTPPAAARSSCRITAARRDIATCG